MLTRGSQHIIYRQGWAHCLRCAARRWVGASLPAAITFRDEHQACQEQPRDGGGGAAA